MVPPPPSRCVCTHAVSIFLISLSQRHRSFSATHRLCVLSKLNRLIYADTPADIVCTHSRCGAHTDLLPCLLSAKVSWLFLLYVRHLFSVFYQCAGMWSTFTTVERKTHCWKGIPVTILKGSAWTNTRDIRCLTYRGIILTGCYVPWGAWLEGNPAISIIFMFCFMIFVKFWSTHSHTQIYKQTMNKTKKHMYNDKFILNTNKFDLCFWYFIVYVFYYSNVFWI